MNSCNFVNDFISFIECNNYDSDAIQEDINCDDINDSNIYQFICNINNNHNNKWFNMIKQYKSKLD